MSAKLFQALWSAQSKSALLKALRANTTGYEIHPIDGKDNNSGVIELATSPLAALIEGITNAHDANIADMRNQNAFSPMPTNIQQALGQMPDPRVHVFIQQARRKTAIVSLTDMGTGMTEEGMRKGVLAIGSNTKPIDALQHGNYGQGGATLYGQSEASLIATRTRGSDHYIFTMVYKEEHENGAATYMFVTKPGGGLFTASAKAFAAIAPDGLHVVAAVRNNSIILPLHGTVRRHYDMALDFSRGQQSSLVRGITTKMFASVGWINIVGDNGSTVQVRGIRSDLNAVQVGESIYGIEDAGPTLACHIETKAVALPSEPVVSIGIEAWVVREWVNLQGNRVTYQRDRLEGKSGDAAAGIIVTLNGQTHARLLSGKLLREAGLPYLSEHMLINVSLDNVPPLRRKLLLSSNRENLTEQGRDWIKAEIDLYVRSHDIFAELNAQMTPVSLATDTDESRDIASIMNRMMNDPLIGGIVKSASSKPRSAGQNSECNNPLVVTAPFEAVEPPSLLMVTTSQIVAGQTCWLKIRTNADDRYGDRLRIIVPEFLTALSPEQALSIEPTPHEGTVLLQSGKAVPSYLCEDVPVGTIGTVMVMLTLDDGSILTSACQAEVVEQIVSRPRKPKPKSLLPDDDATVPEARWVEIGPEDDSYSSTFPGCVDEVPAWNYNYIPATNTIVVTINREFQPITATRQALAKDSIEVADTFYRGVKMALFATAMVLCRNTEMYGPSGAEDTARVGLLSDICRSLTITQTILCRDIEYRTIVERRALKLAQSVRDTESA